MEDFKVRSCRLCFTIINDEDYKLIDSNSKDILINLLKLEFDDDSKHLMCNVCSAKLSGTQKFKMTCIHTDKAINCHVSDTTVSPLDLREIYRKERPSEHISDDVKICRLCMRLIKDISEVKSINEEQVEMIQKLVPEMNILIIRDPVMCKSCLDYLTIHCNFLKKCWNAEQNIGNICSAQIQHSQSPLDVSVKIEDVDMEFGDLPDLIETEYMDINNRQIKTEREIHGQEISSTELTACKRQEAQGDTSLNEHKICMYRWEEYMHDIKYETGLEGHRKLQKDPSTAQVCKSETSSYEIKTGELEQECTSEVQRYQCENCNYVTKHKSCLKRHMLIHETPSELQTYKCEMCNYITNVKRYLKTHMLNHKDSSQIQMYKCDSCDFETKYKGYLKNHMTIHKDPSQVQMHKCRICDFETKRIQHLNSHMQRHKIPSEVQIYKCAHCNYQSTDKSGLKSHMLVHKNSSEVQMYRCVDCNYETKYRNYIKIHVLKHKDPSEVQMYKCEDCDYENKDKNHLKRHMLTHKDASEVQMYKCENCNYETRHKKYLKKHVLIHRDPAQMEMYKCEFCSFGSKDKWRLKRHMLIHKSSSEVDMYKCENCSYETKYKNDLKKHKLTHRDSKVFQI